jgi:hypothetical protein
VRVVRLWTLARVTALIARLFHVRYTLRGTSCLLHRIGLGQAPASLADSCGLALPSVNNGDIGCRAEAA